MKRQFILLLLLSNYAMAGDPTYDIAKSGLSVHEKAYNAIVENVANAKTPGYKQLNTTVVGPGNNLRVKKYNDIAEGAQVFTGGKLDCSIDGPGYFVIDTPHGEGYTRDGRFKINSNGLLVTIAGGFPVKSQNGMIESNAAGDIQISSRADVFEKDQLIDRLLIAKIPLRDLKSLNNVVFQLKNGGAPQYSETTSIKIGYIEQSNLNISQQLMQMNLAKQKFDANTKVIQTRSKLMQGANDMARGN